jgi:hypothetical protein
MQKRALQFAIVLLVVGTAWLLTPRLPDLDDAYIPLHSANSILAGGDANYGTSPLTGITSPPYLLLLTTLRGIGLPPLLALRVATAMGLSALMLSIWALARSARLGVPQQVLLPILVLSCGAIVEQAVNGVETGWAMAVAIGLLAACLSGRPYAAAAASGILPWLRPDLAPIAGLLFVAALWKQPRPVFLRSAMIAGLVFAPWPLWLYLQTGAFVPNTMTAKTAFYATSCLPVRDKVNTVAVALVGWIVATAPASVLAAFWVGRNRFGLIALVGVQAALAAYATLFPIGLLHNHQRYMFPIGVPLIALGLAVAMTRPRRVWLVLTAVSLAGSLILLRGQLWPSQGAERVAAAEWIRDHVDPHAKIMVQDAGVFSIYTPNPLVDFIGLKTPSSIDAHRRLTWSSCGADRSKAMAAIARSSGADYFVVTSDWDDDLKLTAGLAREGISLSEVRTPPVGEYGYYIYRIAAKPGS